MDIIKTLDGLIKDVNNNDIDSLDELQRELIYLKSELEAINYSRCCETLKGKEETAFDLWLKNFKHAERDLYWYNKDTLYCIEAMKDIYNTEVKPTL